MVDAIDDDWWTSEKHDNEEETSLKKIKDSKKTKLDDEQVVPSAKKRKRSAGDGIETEPKNKSKKNDLQTKNNKSKPSMVIESDEDVGENTIEGSIELKKKKKKNKKSISEALAKQKPLPLVPYDLTSAIYNYYKEKLSVVEADDVLLTEAHFAPCNDLTHTATSYLKSLDPHWKKHVKHMSEKTGAPLFLVLCSAGQRASDFARAISEMKVDKFVVAKLFAKHIKLDDHIKFLQSKKVHIGVGSPKRIHQLLDSGALSLEQVKYVVLDWSWRDAKLRRLVDMKEVCADVMELLRKHVLPQVRGGKTKIGLL